MFTDYNQPFNYNQPTPWYELTDKRFFASDIQENIRRQLDKMDTGGEYKIAFQYFFTRTDKEGRKPRITVCYISTANACSIGVAFCSMRDEPDKLVGQTIALGRASKALRTKSSTHPVGNPEVDHIISRSDMSDNGFLSFKGLYVPEFNPKYRIPRVPYLLPF